MKQIGLVVKEDNRAIEKADDLAKWLQAKGVHVVRRGRSKPKLNHVDSPETNAPPELSCIMVLGGDGTFLSAVRWISDQNIPILGVKFGEVGFLAEIAEDNLFSVAKSLGKGDVVDKLY